MGWMAKEKAAPKLNLARLWHWLRGRLGREKGLEGRMGDIWSW